MEAPRLNLDVFYHIVPFLGTYEALHTSLICREAYRIVTPKFIETVVFPLPWLRMPGARRSPLASRETYEGFRAYMLASEPERLGHLRYLDLGEDAFCTDFGSDSMDQIDDSEFDFGLAALLVDVIQNATGLRRLSIAHAEAVFDEVPALADAIADLPQLEEVRFHHADMLALGVLSRMRSRPRKVEFHLMEFYDFQTHARWWGEYAAGRDRFLHNFTETLEVLELSGGADIIEALEPGTVWRGVHELKVMKGDVVNLQTLARVFPNLRRLDLESPCSDDPTPENQWRKLDCVHSAFPLPLQQRIRYLDMYCPIELFPSHGASVRDDTIVLLQHTKPVILACRASAEMFLCVAQAAPTVRFLRADAAPGWSPKFPHNGAVPRVTEADAHAALYETYMLLRNVPLQGIALDWKREFPMSWHDETRWMQYALTIATCIPSLEFIGMRMLTASWETPCWSQSPYGKYHPKAYRWYRAVRHTADDAVRVEEVSSDEWESVELTLFSLCRHE